ncbi:hypothetical protein L226DRAFT_295236 [Lentinus tigrinus ALCF2SS1-7]|uniref:uncharacterized protein n=1 Tax=Lentinus tigrinus ALCF2SS1-7 TaxID=1328758 RepID=UPI00116631A9|nr:hypothetical protein L226DRAFT_295236 [Lentinus tigrinus ALCF2SS1-7]
MQASVGLLMSKRDRPRRAKSLGLPRYHEKTRRLSFPSGACAGPRRTQALWETQNCSACAGPIGMRYPDVTAPSKGLRSARVADSGAEPEVTLSHEDAVVSRRGKRSREDDQRRGEGAGEAGNHGGGWGSRSRRGQRLLDRLGGLRPPNTITRLQRCDLRKRQGVWFASVEFSSVF